MALGLTALHGKTLGAVRDDSIGTLHTILSQYRSQLDEVCRQNGGSRSIPAVRWFAFGWGNRPKLIYYNGQLSEAISGRTLKKWDVVDELIVPPAATVLLTLKSNDRVRIVEQEDSIWLTEGTRKEILSEDPVRFPSFAGHPADLVLKTLYHEILINLVEGKPLSNLLCPSTPRYREAATVAMALKATDNQDLLKDWVLSLIEPFDAEPGAEIQADNLGQVLYLVSLVSDASHPVVKPVLKAVQELVRGDHIIGLSDGAEHPVYQTSWLKFGLQALGLDDRFRIPQQADPLGALFWPAFRDSIPDDGSRFQNSVHPAFTWASDHSFDAHHGVLGDRDFPLTWGPAHGIGKDSRMADISDDYPRKQQVAPHVWHAAEVFLRLLAQAPPSQDVKPG